MSGDGGQGRMKKAGAGSVATDDGEVVGTAAFGPSPLMIPWRGSREDDQGRWPVRSRANRLQVRIVRVVGPAA